jgi:hypothetical protein
MANTSASGGFLTPLSSDADHGVPFENFLQELVAGITGLPSTLVRPRWQIDPPQEPELNVDWATVGIVEETDLNLKAQVRHDPHGLITPLADGETERVPEDGTDVLERTVRNRILVSTFGPNAWEMAARLSDGLAIEQNRYTLQENCIGIINIGPRRVVPELVNNRWQTRVDCSITLNREISRVYPVYTLLSAKGSITANPPGDTTITTPYNTDWYFGA